MRARPDFPFALVFWLFVVVFGLVSVGLAVVGWIVWGTPWWVVAPSAALVTAYALGVLKPRVHTCPVCQARTLTFGRPVTLCPVCRKAKEDVVGMVGEPLRVYRVSYLDKDGIGYRVVRAVDDAEAERAAWEQWKRERTGEP